MVSDQQDEFFCAGIYTFILEEFGKVILLRQCERTRSNKIEVKYADEFTDHEAKFETALGYLEKNGLVYLEKAVTTFKKAFDTYCSNP
jgi:hypothetical protein